ncbi:MAG: hypothetical protein M0Z28_09375 [Rhodospirillales bacterium]|nr:hypothetical protein [Rhodospirillales bacterium]
MDGVLVDPSPVAPASELPAPALDLDSIKPVPRQATLPDPGHDNRCIPLRLAHPDWLHHRLSIIGPEADVAAFRAAAAGAGTIPWHFDLDRMEEDFFHLLVSPPAPQRRTLSVAGARIVAGQLRDAVRRRHALAVARTGSRACPFDLHALVPVPDDILRRGPDDPDALVWLWAHWGTTQELRHVTADTAASQGGRHQPAEGEMVFRLTFWSADWTPWRALAQLAAHWPALRFDTRPTYEAP